MGIYKKGLAARAGEKESVNTLVGFRARNGMAAALKQSQVGTGMTVGKVVRSAHWGGFVPPLFLLLFS